MKPSLLNPNDSVAAVTLENGALFLIVFAHFAQVGWPNIAPAAAGPAGPVHTALSYIASCTSCVVTPSLVREDLVSGLCRTCASQNV